MDYQLLWFVILGVLLTGYAILDGFDLGVGIIHLTARNDHERRLVMNSIGPIWDGNAVWLVTFGGALFAAFPAVYGTAFSAFYLPFMALLGALIFRAVSLEFRSKREEKWWRQTWDFLFFASSFTATFLFGMAVGNAMQGIKIKDGVYQGDLSDLIGIFPILVGFLAVSLFALHGSLYLYLKTEGEFHYYVRRWVWTSYVAFCVLYATVTAFSYQLVPTATERFTSSWVGWVIAGLNFFAVINISRALYQRRSLYAFISSCCSIIAFNVLFAYSLFPNLLISSYGDEHTLTVHNSSSTEKTLHLMAWFAAIGIPFVLAYTFTTHWVFRGKVKITKQSY